MKLFVTLILVHFVASLNILISTTDSWVTKNIRSLYHELSAQNHTVVLVGPLYQSIHSLNNNQKISNNSIQDGGDFGHLLPSNQIYYHNLNKLDKINDLAVDRPKKLLKKEDIEAIDQQFDMDILRKNKANNTNQYGFDPLDTNCVYVNSNNPINILSSFLFNLKPIYFPDFEIDLAIVGPVEGNSESTKELTEEMTKFLLVNQIPTISIESGDFNHIYYNNKLLQQKNNRFTKALKYQNNKVISLVNKFANGGQVLPRYHAINLKFPTYMNSNCKLASNYKFNQATRLFNITYNQFDFVDNQLSSTKVIDFDLVKRDELTASYESIFDADPVERVDEDEEEIFFVDKESNYYKYKVKLAKSFDMFNSKSTTDSEKLILDGCDIAININYLFELDSNLLKDSI